MSFRLAKPDTSGGVPRVVTLEVNTGQEWTKGAPLVISSGKYSEATSPDPTGFSAIALHDVGEGSGPEFPLGRKEFPPNVAGAIALRPTDEYTAKYTGTLGTIGSSYGIALNADDEWVVDFSDTTNTCVKLIGTEQAEGVLNVDRVRVTFLAADITTI